MYISVGDIMKKLLLISALTVLAACSPKNNSSRSATATIAGVPTGVACMNGTSSTNVGSIYDQQNSYDFENRVKALLSATISPSEVGSISSQSSAQTGVRFNGVVKLDGNGTVLGNQSNVSITVYDSVWLYNQTQSNLIVINFNPSKAGTVISGQFNTSSGEGSLSLRDQYGTVIFQGRIDAQNFSGTVSFQNTTSVAGGTPASGNLGQFQIQRCAIFQ